MSALWTPGRAGVSPWFLPQSPAPPSRALLHRSLTVVCAGSRWSWFDAGPAQNWLEMARVGLLHEGRDLLAKGCAYCTKAPPTQSAPGPPSVEPHPRAVHPDDAGSHHSDRGNLLRQVEAAVLPPGRRADAVPAAAVVPYVARSRVIGCDRATYPTNAAGGAGCQAWGARRREGPILRLPILSRPDSRLTHAYREQGHGPGVGLVSLVSTCSQRHLSAALRHPSPPPDERSCTERVPRRNY